MTDSIIERIAEAIWRETYRHDTLIEWGELRHKRALKYQQHHYKRTMAAARATIVEFLRARDQARWTP